MRKLVSGFTLIELIVAVGLFALVMTLASGAYLMMIGANRQAQALATGINNLSFALETMTRDIRTGSQYCGGGSCVPGSFSFVDTDGQPVTYGFSNSASVCGGSTTGCLTREVGVGTVSPLTDPSVNVSSVQFLTSGTSPSDSVQARVTIIVSGTVSSGPGQTQAFTVETGATMRGTDL